MIEWLDNIIRAIADAAPPGTPWQLPGFVNGIIVITLVGLVCGAVGALVVGNRMAFFSDALAHCAFAGVAFAVLIGLGLGMAAQRFQPWITPIMIVFGIVIGVLIAYVREKTALASDTVIGVFFAGSIGLGAMFAKIMAGRGFRNLENFLFGSPLTTGAADILSMLVLSALTVLFLALFYNSLVFASFNDSLARSRQVPTRFCQYAFIALLGVIINLSLNIVGTLLVNAMLIVPAAAASNIAKNMRQLFWWSIILCVGVGLGGIGVSWELNRVDLDVGVGGTIVVLSVVVFAVSLLVGPWRRWRGPAVLLPNTKS